MNTVINFLLNNVVGIIGIIIGVVFTVIAGKASVSLKFIKNYLLVQEYYLSNQTDYQGKIFLMNELLFKHKRKRMSRFYLPVNVFLQMTSCTFCKRKEIIKKIEKENFYEHFGIDRQSKKGRGNAPADS